MGKSRVFIFTGQGVSQGVALGPAYVIESNGFDSSGHSIQANEVEQEIERFHRAVDQARIEVQELGRTVAERIDPQQAAIFDAHVTLLGDPLLIDGTIDRIRTERKNAEFLFWGVTRDIGEQLSALGDAYFSERSHDLYDVARRVIKYLTRGSGEPNPVPEGAIVVADDLGPAEAAQFKRANVAGFCTNSGGPTSHTAIMAKAVSIPAVVGLDFLTHYVRTGDFLVVDGSEGKVFLNPSEDQIAWYRNRSQEFIETRKVLSTLSDVPAVTTDGVTVCMEANIEFPSELSEVLRHGAEGIGLFRTEYFFIERPTLPSELEQMEAYRLVSETMAHRSVVFRTLDIGGDKLGDAVPTMPEMNPFLGLRALRLCLAHPELFRGQLRPMMRAAAGRCLRILLPMVSNLDEITSAKRHIEEVRCFIADCGEPLPTEILVGAMIEIPSAALQADVLARHVDFFSIGTNDLVQYTLAVDRVNKVVAHLFHESHPAVLELISRVVRAANNAGIPLTVCGEMAGTPSLALLLVGLGVRTLSMSPSLIPAVKNAIRCVSMRDLEQLTCELLKIDSPTELRTALEKGVIRISRHASAPIC